MNSLKVYDRISSVYSIFLQGLSILSSNYRRLPFAIWAVTYDCNYHCKFCTRWLHGPLRVNEELTTGQGMDLIDNLASLGVIVLALTGGEPTLRKDLFEIIRYAKSKGIKKIGINSNGSFNKEIAKKIVEVGVDSVFFSLDGIDTTHNYIRGNPNAFKNVINAVHFLMSERNKSQNLVPQIFFNTVITETNYSELMKIAELAQSLEIDGITFQPVHQNPGSYHEVQDRNLYPENIEKIRQMIDLVLSKYNNLLAHPIEYYKLIPEFFENPQEFTKIPCYAGKLTSYISPYGDVSPCEPLTSFSLGNIKEKSFKEIWFSEPFVSFRKQSRSRKCACWFACYGSLNLMLSKIKKNPIGAMQYALKKGI